MRTHAKNYPSKSSPHSFWTRAMRTRNRCSGVLRPANLSPAAHKGKVAVTSFGNVSREGQPRLPVDRTWLTVTLKEVSSGITGLWIYKKNLLKAETITRWISEYESILFRATANSELPLHRQPGETICGE